MGSSSLLAKSKLRYFAAYIIGALLVWAIVGCGGSGMNGIASTGGKLSLTIAWPAKGQSRYLPVYASSLYFSLAPTDFQGPTQTLIVNRPDTLPLVQIVEFNGPLTSGHYSLTGLAMTSADGQGQVVASASSNVFIAPTGVTTVPLTLASTLYSLDLLDVPLNLQPNNSFQLRVRVLDKDKNEVFIPPSDLTWSVVIGKSVASIDDTGTVTGLTDGAAQVRVSELGANLYSQGDVTVSDAPPPMRRHAVRAKRK